MFDHSDQLPVEPTSTNSFGKRHAKYEISQYDKYNEPPRARREPALRTSYFRHVVREVRQDDENVEPPPPRQELRKSSGKHHVGKSLFNDRGDLLPVEPASRKSSSRKRHVLQDTIQDDENVEPPRKKTASRPHFSGSLHVIQDRSQDGEDEDPLPIRKETASRPHFSGSPHVIEDRSQDGEDEDPLPIRKETASRHHFSGSPHVIEDRSQDGEDEDPLLIQMEAAAKNSSGKRAMVYYGTVFMPHLSLVHTLISNLELYSPFSIIYAYQYMIVHAGYMFYIHCLGVVDFS